MTSQEFTSYFAKAKNEAFNQILEIVADLYLNPVFNQNEIEKEKGVIIEEINMYEDMPARRVQELFMELVYGDQPAGWSVAGTKAVIRSLRQEDFLKYRRRNYLPQSTIVVVSGGVVREKQLARIIKQIGVYFSSLPRGRKKAKVSVKESQKIPKAGVKYKESDQTHLVLGFRAFDIFDRRRYALQVLANILGGGMSSRLFQTIRDELGAAYYVNASTDLYSDHGLLGMSAGIDHKRVDEVVKVALHQFSRLKEELVKNGELQKAKDHLIGHLFLSVETSDELGFFYGGQEVMGLPLSTPRIIAKKVQAVKAEEVRALARALFRNNRLNLALIGPFKNKNFSRLLRL
jgi:predicted Zn-dependent peptidase